MDRKAIIAVVLSLVVLVGWQLKTQRDLREWRKAHPEAAAALASAAPTASASASATITAAQATATPASSGLNGVTPQTPQTAPTPEIAQVPEEKLTVTNPWTQYTFTNLGGGIAQAELLKHEGETSDRRMVLNEHGTHPIGAILQDPALPGDEAYTVTEKDGKVICERTDSNGLRITKTFSIPREKTSLADYRVQLEVAFSNSGSQTIEKAGYFLFAGSAEPIHAHDRFDYTGLDWRHGKKTTFIDVHWFDPSKVPILGYEKSPGHANYLEKPGDVVWAGVKNQYFTSIISTVDPRALGVWGGRIDVKTDSKEVKGIEGALAMPGFKLSPGETATQKFGVFVGPKEFRLLQQLGQGEEEIMNFSSFKVIKVISVLLLRSMNWLEGWLHSYALAIIVLTFIVRGALWPVQGKATNSMKRMQLLQPKMTELKEKYKDDPTKMNQELMKLYKEYGVNPFAGCLPMLIQIPIFFGFWAMLGTAVELRNSHFLWVHDLSQPDTVFHLGGIPVNILPLCMAATMVWQMQLTPKSGDPAQQRMFMFMPLVFVVFTYNYASALALYYSVQNILSIAQLYVTRNQQAPALAKVSVASKKRKG